MFAGKQGRNFLTSMGISTLLSYSKLVCDTPVPPSCPRWILSPLNLQLSEPGTASSFLCSQAAVEVTCLALCLEFATATWNKFPFSCGFRA